MSYAAHHVAGMDPYNRAPSPGYAVVQQQPQPFAPPGGGQVTPGTITYTSSTGPDGKIVYHPFKAVAASYQTPQGIVSGIQWVPAEATQIVPVGAMPANAEFVSAWSRPQDREWQREEERRHSRHESEKDAARREKERRKREKAEERELREVRERDKRERASIARSGSPYAGSNSGRISPYAPPAALPRPVSPYSGSSTLPGRPVSPYHGGGALPGRPVSPYHSGGVLPGRPVSPYHGGGALPGRPVSPYHGGGALPGRPVSPYHGGGALPGRPASPYGVGALPGRPVSPYRGGGALPARPASPYHQSTTGRAPSPYHSSNVLSGRPVSPYHQSTVLPSNATYGSYAANQAEIERKMAEVGIGSGKHSEYERRKNSSGGGYAAPGGVGGYPYSSATASPYRSSSPMPNVVQDARPGSPYRPPGSPYRGNVYPPGHVADGRPRSRGPSPSPYGAAGGYSNHSPVTQGDQGMLPAPEGFSRPPSAAQPYTRFENMKVQDMEDFLDHIPRMPLVLVPHDVYHEDWIRLMTDLAAAWVGRLPIPQSARAGGRMPKRATVAADLIDLWNSSFFVPRGVEIILYKGRERRSGRLAGQVDKDLPGFESFYEEEFLSGSDLSHGTDSDSDDGYGGAGGRYGHQGSVYGRRNEVAELREARKRRKEIEEDEKRKKRDRARKRIRELEKKYSVYLTCTDRSGYR